MPPLPKSLKGDTFQCTVVSHHGSMKTKWDIKKATGTKRQYLLRKIHYDDSPEHLPFRPSQLQNTRRKKLKVGVHAHARLFILNRSVRCLLNQLLSFDTLDDN